ncbi:hypothetical protein XCR_4129 [Xanthomonas campestris pv. raphani 756C]|nr:hypothetical protein XCR_4129 [Xanthomonas campestris pv. raphani 756C]
MLFIAALLSPLRAAEGIAAATRCDARWRVDAQRQWRQNVPG